MNDLKGPPIRDVRARRPDDLDELLRRFFWSEMPDPWPAPPQVRATRRAQGQPTAPRRWFRPSSRLALAAAVSFFLVGYLTLAGSFPHSGALGVDPIHPKAGKNEKPGARKPGYFRDAVPAPKQTLPNPGEPMRLTPVPLEFHPLPMGKAQSSGYRSGGTTYLHVQGAKLP
jgi:hypothetical protein